MISEREKEVSCNTAICKIAYLRQAPLKRILYLGTYVLEEECNQVMTELVVDNWTERHDLVALLKATGNTNQEIAQKLDYDQAYVSRILKDPRAVRRIEEIASQIADAAVDVGVKLKLLANEALDRAVYWMRKDNDELATVSLRSAFGILDRAGYSKVEKKLIGHFEASPDKLEEMLRLAEKANRVQEEYNYGGREIVVEPDGDGDGASPGPGGDSS